MKRTLLVISITLLSIASYSQVDNAAIRMYNKLDEKAKNKKSYYKSNVEGSPYWNTAFTPALVNDVPQVAMMRYEANADEFEFINTNKDTLVLSKEERFSTITFKLTNTKYKFVNYIDKKGEDVNGYLILLADKNNFVFYKKQTINFIKEKFETSSYDISQSARFERGNDIFYFKDKGKAIAEFPNSKKKLIKLFPEKKTELETFIKENKIDFDKESDLIKLANYLAG
jgi:uncharacterized protein YneR